MTEHSSNRVQENVSLAQYNSLGFDVSARYLIHAHDINDLLFAREFAQENNTSLLLLGGGSNVVFTQNYDGVVVIIQLPGKTIEPINDYTFEVVCQAGENWHDFVRWTLEHNAQGLENLSLIPGTVGASPVQNIGAYGTDINDWLVSLKALDMHTGQLCEFLRDECEFAYRDSVFKSKYPQRYVITELTFHLNTPEAFNLNVSYGGLLHALEEKDVGASDVTPMMVSDLVCDVRRAKLPDPAQLGNAGSFFKNPVVSAEQAERLQNQFETIVAYPQADGQVKLAAGWLIEKAGFKGTRFDGVGVHDKQALVLVNHGEGTGKQLIELARRIQAEILEQFGVELEIEPRVY